MTSKISEALLTDLYQLTMMQAYFERRMTGEAVFELFVRRLPTSRHFLVAAGLEQALDFLESLRFSDSDLEFLRSTGKFRSEFLDSLKTFRFTGTVHAVLEGTPVFAQEPIIQVTASVGEAQYFETRLVNIINAQTMMGSKAARSKLVAPNKLLVEFGLRRAHGGEAAMFAARASYLAGFSGTSNVAAGAVYGVPIYGTMAHSFVEAHDSEERAFEDFLKSYPNGTTLLIDTYDTERAAKRAANLIKRLGPDFQLAAVRLDSGDLLRHAKQVRVILDDAGLNNVTIFASGNLDEERVHELLVAGAPIDGFGIGTSLTTSADAPSLDAVYKLQEYAGVPRKKLSEKKATWPGRKQVFRQYDSSGIMSCDTLARAEESLEGEPLLTEVMRDGRRLDLDFSLEAGRQRWLRLSGQLRPEHRRLAVAKPYDVEVSPELKSLSAQLDAALRGDTITP